MLAMSSTNAGSATGADEYRIHVRLVGQMFVQCQHRPTDTAARRVSDRQSAAFSFVVDRYNAARILEIRDANGREFHWLRFWQGLSQPRRNVARAFRLRTHATHLSSRSERP